MFYARSILSVVVTGFVVKNWIVLRLGREGVIVCCKKMHNKKREIREKKGEEDGLIAKS